MPENKFEFPGSQPEQEKELSPEEREQLKREMSDYLAGLKARIEEIKAEIFATESEEEKEGMTAELAEFKEQAAGLEDFAGAIDEAESIKTKPYKGK